AFAGEEDELLGTARRVRRAGEALAAGERVDQARFADIGAARERDLERPLRWQRGVRSRRRRKLPVGGEQRPPGLDLVSSEVGHKGLVVRGLDPRAHQNESLKWLDGLRGRARQ